MPFVPSSFLLLVVRPRAPSSVLAPTSNGLQPNSDESLIFGFHTRCFGAKVFTVALPVFAEYGFAVGVFQHGWFAWAGIPSAGWEYTKKRIKKV